MTSRAPAKFAVVLTEGAEQDLAALYGYLAEFHSVANANRVLHGTPKPLRDLAKARTQKAEQTLKGHRLEPEK